MQMANGWLDWLATPTSGLAAMLSCMAHRGESSVRCVCPTVPWFGGHIVYPCFGCIQLVFACNYYDSSVPITIPAVDGLAIQHYFPRDNLFTQPCFHHHYNPWVIYSCNVLISSILLLTLLAFTNIKVSHPHLTSDF
jgi:hypothetical protein